MNLANPWGIAGTDSSDESAFKMVKDGKVVGTADTEEFRSFLEFAHQLVEEGLLDMESFSQTSEQYHAKLSLPFLLEHLQFYTNLSKDIIL